MPEQSHELTKVMQSARELMNLSEVAQYQDTMIPGIQSVRETARRMVGVTPEMRAKFGHAGTDWSGRVRGGVGGLIKGFDDIGVTLPATSQIGDRRGHTTREMLQTMLVRGHIDGEGGEGEASLKHKGDKVVLGHKDYPTSWYVHKRIKYKSRGTWGGWKTDWERRFDLPAGGKQEIENLEHSDAFSGEDQDIYITLLSVGRSAEEETTFQKARTDAQTAISNAKGQATKLKNIGGDDTAIQNSITAAQAAYDKGDYKTALSTANTALAAAINATALQEKKNVELEKQKIRNDPSLDSATKKKMLEDLDKEKKAIDERTEKEKENLGLPTIDLTSPWVIGGIIGIIAVIGVGAAAAAMSKKKKATA